jgi:hypothetical protein
MLDDRYHRANSSVVAGKTGGGDDAVRLADLLAPAVDPTLYLYQPVSQTGACNAES